MIREEETLETFAEEDELDILADVYAFIIERIEQRARQEQIRAQNESQESA